MARSWVGLTIFACLPCIVVPQLLQSVHSYEKSSVAEECYECVIMSSKKTCQTRPPSTLRHKVRFPYEYILAHAITWRGMHVHAVLSLKEARIRSMTEKRIAQWPHRLDV